jgi:hypothetical protein
MPSIKDQSTVKAIAREFTSNGRDKAEAMRTVGYALSSCRSGCNVGKIYADTRVIAAIKAIDDKNKAKIEHTKETSLSKLQEVVIEMDDILEDKNVSANVKMTACRTKIAAIAEQNAITGLHKQTIVNETEQQRDLSEAQRKAAEELAVISNREAIRKANAG